MQAIMLAAGMGSRLQKYTKDNTKCMLEVNGIKLIDRTLDALSEAGIDKLVLVVGYQKENLKEYLGTEKNGVKIEYVDNDIYDSTNSIYSLYLAKDYFLKEDSILLESDLIYDNKLITDLVNDGHANSVVVAPFERWMDGTVVSVDNSTGTINNFIPKQMMDWANTHQVYKTVNIYKFSKEFMEEKYLPYIEAYIKANGNNSYYEAVFSALQNIEKLNLNAHILGDTNWYEIDDAQDLDIAETIFATGVEKLEKMQHRFGGYWRFPKVRDFNLLVNPHFPTKAMQGEFHNSFEVLMSEYPSRQSIIDMLISKMFKVEEKHIKAANGSAEFINYILDILDDKTMGIVYPTFNEYPNRAKGSIKKLYLDNLEYGPKELIEHATKENVDIILLINPDNPSGNYLTREEVLEVFDYAKANNKKVIYDESFGDFASSEERFTMIKDDILEKYDNIYVIKSIGKSYGVAGLRLGVLATSDVEMLEAIQKKMSIWAVNSFAEYFLQIIGKYQGEYIAGCDAIVEEREMFMQELNNLSYIKAYPSRANYILCELTDKYTNEELALKLLDKDIFIKVLNKKGLGESKFIRLAVRDRKDNLAIIHELKELDK